MASDQEFVDYLLDLFDDDCRMSARKMFGEYGVYADGVFVGMVCDDRLFFKRSDAGRALLGEPEEASPYPGAKPIFVMTAEQLEDPELLSAVARATRDELGG